MTIGNWNRPGVKRRLAELATHALAGFEFSDGREATGIAVATTWDPAQAYGPTFFLGLADGAIGPAGIARTNAISDDEFTIGGHIALPGYSDHDLAEEDVMAAMRAFDGFLRTSRRLTHDDVAAAEPEAFHGITKAYLANLTGPFHEVDQAGAGTIAGVATFSITCSTSIQS